MNWCERPAGPIKRYVTFAYEDYYPMGGIEDFIGDFDTLAAAQAACDARSNDNHDIIDLQTGLNLYRMPVTKSEGGA